MEKKQMEIENYLSLISVFSDYEKYTLLEYSENDDNKLVFFNPKNTELCLKLIKLVKKINFRKKEWKTLIRQCSTGFKKKK